MCISLFMIKHIATVVFDMDGTLVDSDSDTALSVQTLTADERIDILRIDYSGFDGASWKNIAQGIIEQAPQIAIIAKLSERLQANLQVLLENNPPPAIAAHLQVPVEVVSSSLPESIQATI